MSETKSCCLRESTKPHVETYNVLPASPDITPSHQVPQSHPATADRINAHLAQAFGTNPVSKMGSPPAHTEGCAADTVDQKNFKAINDFMTADGREQSKFEESTEWLDDQRSVLSEYTSKRPQSAADSNTATLQRKTLPPSVGRIASLVSICSRSTIRRKIKSLPCARPLRNIKPPDLLAAEINTRASVRSQIRAFKSSLAETYEGEDALAVQSLFLACLESVEAGLRDDEGYDQTTGRRWSAFPSLASREDQLTLEVLREEIARGSEVLRDSRRGSEKTISHTSQLCPLHSRYGQSRRSPTRRPSFRSHAQAPQSTLCSHHQAKSVYPQSSTPFQSHYDQYYDGVYPEYPTCTSARTPQSHSSHYTPQGTA